MNLKIKVTDPAMTPTRAHPGDAGLDLKTAMDIELKPGAMKTVFTRVSVEIPHGYVGLVFMRSGLARKYGVSLVNGTGVIDSGYRGEIGASLVNHGPDVFRAQRGERIAQLVVMPLELPDVVIVEDLSESDRGEGGFGSTGR